MATITSLGVGTNGLDTQSLVDKLVANEQVPLTQLNTLTTGLKTQISAYGQIQSALSAVQDAARKLTNPSTWGATTASSSDPSSVSVVAGNGAPAGNINVQVTQLATAQSVASPVQASSTAALGSGSLTIELGTWSTDKSSFTSKTDASPVTINVAAGATLSSIRDQINSSGAGVVASVVTDSTGSRLVMRSSATGETNGFRITASDADGNNSDASGLSALAYDPTSGTSGATLTQSAGNAIATLNGLTINSDTNTLTQAIDGLSITLLKPTTAGGTTLSVTQDSTSTKTAITNFVTAYNALNSLLRDDTKYDADTKTAGTLQGDSTAVGLTYSLRNLISGTSTLGGAMTRLADIGLDPQADGSLQVDDTKLSGALADPESLKSMLMGLDKTNAANSGFAQQFVTFTTQALGVDGTIATRTAGLQARVDANGKSADALQAHIDQVQARLQAQYSALDTQMASLNSLSTYVSQQMAMLNGTTSK
ncbi:flagellar filament capping protein FliD [Paucibacter sp. R3-3]|uniref:Flagellar hook-associated protein 2 n=1 Tax=Roseateles agri TaxID=3098619 RepID=A0ABU5DQL4_9BURK|nr:flagellar filament capping protein FliD [Paucibacter sp. R3-3]MDY0748404.1 flagellar filament capping protein FliD [Paucibacter sp. R3-3]